MFTLLHTNDFHNHLTSSQADILRQLRQVVGERGLLVDAGDAVASGNVTFRPWGETILSTMSDIGYDALTVGNREFHVSQVGFYSKLKLARFPVLCANVRPSGESKDSLPVRSHHLCTLKDESRRTLKILLFGLTVPMVTERMTARHASAYLFQQPIACATERVPQWKAEHKPDLTVALSHIGYPQDRKLAEAVPGIDLIIGGHSHTRLPNGEWVGDTLIVQTGCFAHHVGCVIVVPNASSEGASNRFMLQAGLMGLPKNPTEAEASAILQQFLDVKRGISSETEKTV